LIEVSVRLKRGARIYRADIAAEARVLALVGPSGAGKTTLLNMIAGLAPPDEGRIAIGGETFFDSAMGLSLPPRVRRLGYVFQDARLFPHLSVAANLRYGMRFAPGATNGVAFDEVVDLLGVRALLGRRPGRLSGGETQRVAIGRALLSQPRALLLDEPLSAIDEARRLEILELIERLRDAYAIPILLVSHRFEEVERLADAIVDIDEDGGARLRNP
jgi:molybdate transport system ATP-binding protein